MVAELGVRVPKRHQSHQCQAEFNHTAQDWARSSTQEKGSTVCNMGRRALVSNDLSVKRDWAPAMRAAAHSLATRSLKTLAILASFCQKVALDD
jgi:hypothetical protein